MNTRSLFLIVILAVVIVGVAAWLFTARTHAQGGASDSWQLGGPQKVIDHAARAATTENEASIHALTESIFSYPHAFGRMPGYLENAVKDSLTQAEVEHLRGIRTGVTEEDVANLVNQCADRLHLPAYAKTSARQVRVLRMSLATSSPVFIGRNLADPNADASNMINPEMSPLQAVHLAAVLVDQKFLDPDYQVTPDEWENTFQQKQVEKIQRLEELRKAASSKPGQYFISARSNPKLDEMRQAFANGVATLGPADASDLIKSSLEALGIR